jgi:hypothetical protein
VILKFTDKDGLKTMTAHWTVLEQKTRPGISIAYHTFGGLKANHYCPNVSFAEFEQACRLMQASNIKILNMDSTEVVAEAKGGYEQYTGFRP